MVKKEVKTVKKEKIKPSVKPEIKIEKKAEQNVQNPPKVFSKEQLWHSTSHIMADAVKRIWPDVKLAIGPAIEEGFYYDFDKKTPFTEDDLVKIENEMRKIIDENLKFLHSEKDKKEAEKLLKGEPYKLELMNELKDKKVSFYQHGNFIDMCAGPHVDYSKRIKAVKLLKAATAYWRGDSSRPQLQRIYGISFATKPEMESFMKMREEAEKRDHRKIGREDKLFMTHELSLAGSPFFLPKGTIIYNELLKFIREEYARKGYKEVITPLIYKKKLWETSGHWEHYHDGMFTMKINDQEYSLKPMNCPSHCLIYQNDMKSYRDLPLRIADFACLHRNELGGVLGGLTRVTKFSQDDAHIFCAEEQVMSEMSDLLSFITEVYGIFKFEYKANLSTRPEKFMGEKKQWDRAEKSLKEALEKNHIVYDIKEGDGAFYGPKIDFEIKDAIGRSWQLATIQLDFQMPQRFELSYEGADGKKHTPVMIHRAILGSLERFMGVIIESYAGKFPLWLSPVQVKVLSMGDDNAKYTQKIVEVLAKAGIRVEADYKAETIQNKVRIAQLEKVPYMLVIGKKEEEAGTISVRTREGKVQYGVKIDAFVKQIVEEIEKKVSN